MKYIIIVTLYFISNSAQAIHVLFICPTDGKNHFWQQVENVAHAASDDLQINLEIIQSSRKRHLHKKVLYERLTKSDKPDYVIFLAVDGSAIAMFEHLEAAKIPFMTLERVVYPETLNQLGIPGYKYKHWLGEVFHDNIHAGELLADALIKQAKESSSSDTPLYISGIAGDKSGVSENRKQGLLNAIERHPDIQLNQVVYANFYKHLAQQRFSGLLNRYERTHIVWTAGDAMALGVIDEAKFKGLKANQDFVVGGIDWTPAGLNAIEQNKLTASVGGHFMQVAWALIKIYDHHFSYKRLTQGHQKPSYQMQLITKNNLGMYSVLQNNPPWDAIDFSKLSQKNKKNHKGEQFDLTSLLPMLDQAKLKATPQK